MTISAGSKLYLDTTTIIYASEGSPLLSPGAQSLLLRIDSGELLAVTSELTLAEVLVKPIRDRNPALADIYRARMRTGRTLEVLPVTRDVLERAAALRAEQVSLKLPDAIHAATALIARCDLFVTNDFRFSSVPGLNPVLLSGV
jgi:predicted nucleic acid-binding protein